MQLQETASADVKLDDEWWLRNDGVQYPFEVRLDRDTSTILSVKNVSSKGAVFHCTPIQLWKTGADATVMLF